MLLDGPAPVIRVPSPGAPGLQPGGLVSGVAGPRAWWSGALADLLAADVDAIIGRLALQLIEQHPGNRETQLRAWRRLIEVLRTELASFPRHWRVIIEYNLLRLGRRIECVVLTERAILVLAFNYTGLRSRERIEDDALDLHDFHAGSRGCPIIPILVGRETPLTWPLFWHGVRLL